MKKYLAVDSGGTKVLAVLYDEEFRPIKIIRIGSCRGNTTSDELIEKNLKEFREKLGLEEGMEIELVTGVAEQPFLEALQKYCKVRKTVFFGELQAGLYAAELFDGGLLALSGTGSQLSAVYQGDVYIGGAYGASISDLGSGYWMGRNAMEAAIADYEGYGERTLLTDLLARKYGGTRETFRESVFKIYERTEQSPVAHVASCAVEVSEAARQGDSCAERILKETGEVLGKQLTALINKWQMPDELPVTISGSVWKSEKVLFDTFTDSIRKQSPNRPVIMPRFEPIVGFILKHYRDVKGSYTEEDRKKFEELYPQFCFKWDGLEDEKR